MESPTFTRDFINIFYFTNPVVETHVVIEFTKNQTCRTLTLMFTFYSFKTKHVGYF